MSVGWSAVDCDHSSLWSLRCRGCSRHFLYSLVMFCTVLSGFVTEVQESCPRGFLNIVCLCYAGYSF